MTHDDRRTFLKQAALGAASATLLASHASAEQAGGDKLRLALIGCGGRGTGVATSFARMADVALTHVCDPDERRVQAAAQAIEAAGQPAPQQSADMRRVLDDANVDAVIIGTPDHWHAPATILAVDAGKHVYVEKPCSHNIREGRLMLEAARRTKKVVQVGTQSRSTSTVAEAMKRLRDGAIGTVLVAKAWNSQRRGSIGHAQPSDPPQGVDWDLWVGPAPMVPFQANRYNPVWRWCYHFGTGDMGNDGVHDIDIARWGLGVDRHPSRVSAAGGKYFYDDDQEFPDTQYVVFEYPGEQGQPTRQLVYEHRIWSPYVQEGFENGDAFYGTDGMLLLGKNGGWQLFGPRNKLVEEMKGSVDDVAHQRDFLNAVRTGSTPTADIEIGHLSATLAHLGNIAVRVGRSLTFDPQTERIVNDAEADALTRREYRDGHWAAPEGV